MSDTTETAEEKEDVRSSTSTLLDQDEDEDEKKKEYVDLENNKSEALGAQTTTSSKLVVWMVVNTLATIGIVRLCTQPRLLSQMPSMQHLANPP